MIRQALYLHGFASSPQSTKAMVLTERLGHHGVRLVAPDFNEPDFFTLTVTRMLEQTDREIAALPPEPVALIGSSLGGFVAVHAAAQQKADTTRPIAALVLLAPALEFGRDRLAARDQARWRRGGSRDGSKCFTTLMGVCGPWTMRFIEDAHTTMRTPSR